MLLMQGAHDGCHQPSSSIADKTNAFGFSRITSEIALAQATWQVNMLPLLSQWSKRVSQYEAGAQYFPSSGALLLLDYVFVLCLTNKPTVLC